MAAADAEIEAEFALTQEDLVRARKMDRESVLAGMDHKRRHVAQQRKAWYEANREKVAQQQKAYREAKRLFGGGDA